MIAADQYLHGQGPAGDLFDRVMQLRRILAGITTDNAELRREVMRLKQANRALESKLKSKAQGPDAE